jgi:hypothetical protein
LDKNKLLFALIIVGVLAGLCAAANRYKIESHNRRVETVVDYADAYNLSIASRLPFSDTLARLQRAGIKSVALTEDSIDGIRLAGAMSVLALSPAQTELTFPRSFPGQLERVESALANKTSVSFHRTGDKIVVDAPYNQISTIGAGLNPIEIKNAIDAGMYVCPRLYNYPGVTTKSIAWMLERVKAQCTRTEAGAQKCYTSVLIFAGPDVLGNRSNIDDTTMALESTGLYYGSIEFGKQIGDIELSEAVESSLVRVHSIGGSEMATMDAPTAVGRFILGARERNIRLLYIRLFQTGLNPTPYASNLPGDLASLPQPLLSNVSYIWLIRQGLKEGGMRIGLAHPYADEPIPATGILRRLLLVLMGLGAAASGVLLVRLFTGLTGRGFWGLLAFSLLFGAVMAMRQHSLMGRQIMALVAAIALPTIGLITLRVPELAAGVRGWIAALDKAFRSYVTATLWTLLGIALVVGLLADRMFMLHIDGFQGIRLAIIMPMVLTLIFHGLGQAELATDATWEERKAHALARWQAFVYSPLMMGQTMAFLIGFAITAVVVLRSGNDPGVGVSGTEMSFRSVLNRLLFVRPRTKEFLFGHPLFILGLAEAFAGRRKWLTLFLAAGAIGQASLLNTFCHIHTPLFFSVIRAVLGWVIGAGIGAVLFALLNRIYARLSATKSPATPPAAA